MKLSLDFGLSGNSSGIGYLAVIWVAIDHWYLIAALIDAIGPGRLLWTVLVFAIVARVIGTRA